MKQNSHCVILASLLLASPILAQQPSRGMGGEARTTTSADGVKIRYQVAGLKQPGPPIVFVHGFSANRTFWEPHFSAFARSHPVVAVDLAGFGESGTDRDVWTMKGFGKDVLATLKDLDLRDAVLVGHSMGAAAVVEAATQDPSRVRGVVVVDVLQEPDYRYASDQGRKFFAGMQSWWHRTGYHPPPPPIEPMPDSLLARYSASTPEVMPEYWLPIIKDFFRWASDDFVPDLKKLRVPLAAINADYASTNVAAYRRYVPGFQLRLMPRVGHLAILWQETDLFQRHLEELSQAMEPGLAKAAPTAAAPVLSPTGVRAAIEWTNERLEGWYRTGQIDSVSSYFVEDARQMPPGAPALVGREAIRGFWSQAAASGEWNFALATQEVSASGDLAAERGLYSMRYTPGPNAPKQLSAPISDHGRYVVLWRRASDGVWRIAWDAPVSDVPPASPAPASSSADDVAAINALRNAWRAAAVKSDLEGYMRFFTPDAVVMIPGAGALTIEPFRAHVKAFYDSFRIMSEENRSSEIVVAGDWAFDRGVYHSTYRPLKGGADIQDIGQVIYILRRERDGGWKYARVIFNATQ